MVRVTSGSYEIEVSSSQNTANVMAGGYITMLDVSVANFATETLID